MQEVANAGEDTGSKPWHWLGGPVLESGIGSESVADFSSDPVCGFGRFEPSGLGGHGPIKGSGRSLDLSGLIDVMSRMS